MLTVTVNVVVPSVAPTVNGVSAVVRIRDVTYADASELVAESRRVVDVAPDMAPITFSIDVPDEKLSDDLTLNLEAHIDLDGSGNFSTGDLVSMKPHRILPDTHDIEVPVSVV
ncbi:MAG: YbaY family lipoprotein [Actinobacteria bacterium]|nr:YbaY family lipoprotein [Actinomycetota bacterium]